MVRSLKVGGVLLFVRNRRLVCFYICEEDYNIVGQLRKIESSNDFCTTAVNSSPRR